MKIETRIIISACFFTMAVFICGYFNSFFVAILLGFCAYLIPVEWQQSSPKETLLDSISGWLFPVWIFWIGPFYLAEHYGKEIDEVLAGLAAIFSDRVFLVSLAIVYWIFAILKILRLSSAKP